MAEYVNPRAQSCQNCVKAKAKCYGHTDGKCERCNRMHRECLMQVPIVRKRKAGKTAHETHKTGRIAELEGRLNDLVSRLPLPLNGEDASPVFTPESTNTLSSALTTFPNQQTLGAEEAGDTLRDDGAGFESASTFPDPSRSTTDPDELLDVFRRKLARQVPFISVPEQMSALNLYRERPFLYQAIVTVSSYHDSVHQIDLGHQFLKHITEHLVVQGFKNLDMLQGLLVYTTWYNGLFHARSQLTTLLGFAFTLLIDLHLYLPMANFEKHEKFLDEMKGIFHCNHVAWARTAEPSREEKRTLLGCFYLFTCVSTTFCRYNPLQWTSYIQDCHNDISSAPENENDIYLAQLLTLQRISEGVRQSGLRSFPSQTRVWNAATGVHFKLLLSELQKFKVSLPENLKQDALILMHYHAVEMYLFEIGFFMPPTTLTDTPTLQRAEVLLMCHHATRAFSDVYFSIDFDAVPFINFSPVFISQIYFVMMTLSKLSLFDADDWDASNVQTTLDLSTVLDLAVTMTEAASARYDKRDDNKPWLQVTRRMRQVKVRFERLLANENRDLAAAMPGTQIQGDSTDMSMPLFLNQFDLLDDRFWQNLPDGEFIA
ncbi:Transcriptional regulator [Lachnellula willkommii]|uniref:Transcriptional regulator n=1 Tax=Lachnellula willkommii TaxID=215461 RepID=A0A559M859_9HELO|nr:Transcriptional regulator [Lachnellula willkommii]